MASSPTYTQALRYWLKLGCTSFGGPAGQIAMMHSELVDKRRWISEGRFLHALNYCMVLPGPEAQQLATYIGWLMHGTKGGIAAGALFVLPSLLLLIALSWAYMAVGAGVSTTLLYGVKPVVVAIVLFAAWRIGNKVLKQPVLWAVAALAFLALFWRLPFPLLVLGAGLLGWLLRARLKGATTHASASQAPHPSALIDDDTPIPAHALFRWSRLVAVLLIGLLLWAAAMAALLLAAGPDAAYVHMSRFFSQAALVTFGGAYAVMPYVFQNAVQTFGWLTPTQMLDGLALGESTPGPLIMVVAFIGYVAGWAQAQPGFAAPLAAALGAVVATYFTFLPSFIFILAGGPWVEHTRDNFRLAGPLTAITAAVVGTILSLAAFLAWHLLWPQGWSGGFDAIAAAMAVAASVALVRNWLGVVPLIVLGAGMGVFLKLAGLA